MTTHLHTAPQGARRAAPKPARVPPGDRLWYCADEGHTS